MALIKYATKEITAKIVYYGPGLSGKTTNLQYINQKKPGGKCGELLSLATEGDRTLFFDLLPMNVGMIAGFRLRFQLFTVPGQIFYNKTRKMVLRDADGVVFVADSQAAMRDRNIESLENLKDNLRENGLDYATIPFVLQFNKRDLPNTVTADELSRALNDKSAEYFEAVATTGEGVLETLQHLMKLVLFDLDKKYNIYKPRVRESDEERKPATTEVPAQPAGRPTPPPRPAASAATAPTRDAVGSIAPAPRVPVQGQSRPQATRDAVGSIAPAPASRPPPPVRPVPRPAGPPESWDLTARVREEMEDVGEEEEEAAPVEAEGRAEEPAPIDDAPPGEEPLEEPEPIGDEEVEEEEEEAGDEELEGEEERAQKTQRGTAEEAGAQVDEKTEAAGDIDTGTEEDGEAEEIQDLTDAVRVEDLTEAPAGEEAAPVPEPTPAGAGPRAAPEPEPRPAGEVEVTSGAQAALPPQPPSPVAVVPASQPASGIAIPDPARLARIEEAYRDISAKIDEFMMEFRDAFVEGKITRDKDKRDLLQAIYELRQTPDMMTAKEVAAYLNVSSGSIYQLAKDGKIPCTRLEGRRKWIFPKALIDEWIIRKAKEE